MKILLGVTGSVAAKLTPKLVKLLLKQGHVVQVVATEKSLYFWNQDQLEVPVVTEADEWPGIQYDQDAAITHIALREWADLMLIAPLTANTLGKMANGLCDNLLTSIVRAWDRQKPVVVAPAMNTKMWEHPLTAEHLNKLGEWYPLSVVQPVAKKLACGDYGLGAMADLDSIVQSVQDAVNSLKQKKQEPKSNKKITVIGGPIAQAIDPVLNLVPTGKGKLAHQVASEFSKHFNEVDRLGNFEGSKKCDYVDLEQEVLNLQSDVVIFLPHIANVLVEKQNAKIRVAEGWTGEIKITGAPKLLNLVKKFHPEVLLVPFKLAEADMGKAEIVKWMLESHAALAVYSRLGNSQSFWIIDALGNEIPVSKNDLPGELVAQVKKYLQAVRRRSVKIGEAVPEVPHLETWVNFSRKMQPAFSQLMERNVATGRWPGNFSFRCTHGFLSERCEQGFVITKRNVAKSGLQPDDFVLVNLELEDDQLSYQAKGEAKPSIDAPIHRLIYEKLAWVKSIVHGHLHIVLPPEIDFMLEQWPCGAENEALELLEIAPQETVPLWVINISGHGFIALIGAEDPSDSLEELSRLDYRVTY
ncbi:MAG: class II aldolase/adducin family protein [Candidatus Parcubacteria bacterium]|nr:class II aldolase/adducin family protein [Candidatus Parcubacteria bacterium]